MVWSARVLEAWVRYVLAFDEYCEGSCEDAPPREGVG